MKDNTNYKNSHRIAFELHNNETWTSNELNKYLRDLVKSKQNNIETSSGIKSIEANTNNSATIDLPAISWTSEQTTSLPAIGISGTHPTDKVTSDIGIKQPTGIALSSAVKGFSESLLRELQVFGGALAVSAKEASSDPASLIKLGEGVLAGTAMTILQAKCQPLAVGLEMVGLAGVISANQSMLKSVTEITDVWKRTWNSSLSVQSDKAVAQKLTNSVVDFGLYTAGGITSPALRALQLRSRWQAAENIPFYRKPSIPPEQKMIDVFEQKQKAHGMIVTLSKTGTGPDTTYSIANGTGIVLKDYDNLVLTAHHVVEKGDAFEAIFPGHKRSPIELLGTDKKLDVALLRMTDAPTEPLPGISLSTVALEKGQDVVLIGYPGKHPGIRASFGTFAGKDHSQRDVFALESAGGFSGGSLLNESGELTSMITALRGTDFLPGARERLIKNGGKVSLGTNNVDLRSFIEANRHNAGIKRQSIEEWLQSK